MQSTTYSRSPQQEPLEESTSASSRADSQSIADDFPLPSGGKRREYRRGSYASRKVDAEALLVATTDARALLPLPVVLALVNLGRTTLYDMIGSGTFPKPLRVGAKLSRWKAGEVHDWLRSHGGGEDPAVRVTVDHQRPPEESTHTQRQLGELARNTDALVKSVDTLVRLVEQVEAAMQSVERIDKRQVAIGRALGLALTGTR